ncbi:fructose-1,6-bisphosphatase, type I [Vibrio sp. JCM 18904]|nr:fructose-1,6-bisphosphatase, type I [Vibrio sp. JCM 18904]
MCGVASEEEDEAVAFNKELNQNAKYVVLMDHLMVLLTSM